jgi:hypothetical protein
MGVAVMGRARHLYRRSDAAVLEALWGSEGSNAAEQGSTALKDRIDTLFRNWEHDNGFVEGAAKILLPAGWREQ